MQFHSRNSMRKQTILHTKIRDRHNIIQTVDIEYFNCFVTQKTYVITTVRHKNNKQSVNAHSNEPALLRLMLMIVILIINRK